MEIKNGFGKKKESLRGQAQIGRTSFSARPLKGQAAMEYLMTYGWAILVIVIVLAVLLFYLPQFLRAPESCVFAQAGFSCSDKKPTIYIPTGENTVHLAINVFNGQGKAITVHNVLCTTAAVGDVLIANAEPPGNNEGASIPAGGSRTYDTARKDSAGNDVSLSAGGDFRGSFVIWYNFQDDVQPAGGSVKRQTQAVISGPVLQQ